MKRLKPLIEYEVYVPTKGGATEISALKDTLTEYFGGLTDTTHKNKGMWKFADHTIKDELVIWRIMSSKGRSGDQLIYKTKEALEAALGETEILVVRRKIEKII